MAFRATSLAYSSGSPGAAIGGQIKLAAPLAVFELVAAQHLQADERPLMQGLIRVMQVGFRLTHHTDPILLPPERIFQGDDHRTQKDLAHEA